MKAKDTLLLNNTITQNPIFMRRAWFWHVASHLLMNKITGTVALPASCLAHGWVNSYLWLG